MANTIRVGALCGVLLLVHPAQSQQTPGTAPQGTEKPVFVPGLYDTESRNSAFEHLPDGGAIRDRSCLPSADYEAFRRETLAQYETNPDFRKVCAIGNRRDLPDGFAFSLICPESTVDATFHFAKDQVTGTTRTQVKQRPGMGSDIVTVSRRLGPCTESAGRAP